MLFILSNYQEIIGIASNSSPKAMPYFDDDFSESIETGVVTYEFSVPANHEKAGILHAENHVVVRDLDYDLVLFTIKEVEEEHKDGILIKRVFCENTAVSELLSVIIPPSHYVSVTLRDAVNKLTEHAIDWRIDMGSLPKSGKSETLEFKTYTNMLDALHQLTSKFNVEFYFSVSLGNFHIMSKTIHIVEKRGLNRGMRFEYGRNLTSVKRKYNSTGVVTALYGVSKKDYYYQKGKQLDLSMHPEVRASDIYKPKDAAWVGSKLALSRWGTSRGHHKFDIYTSETAETPEELFAETVEELHRRSNPLLTYEASIQTLESLIGHSGKVVRIGDTITIIDKEFTPELIISARILAMNRSLTNPQKGSVKLGEYRPIKPNLSQKLSQLQDFVLGYQGKIIESVTTEDIPIIKEEVNQELIIPNIVYKVEIHSSNGTTFKNGQIDTELEARVYHGASDVTSMDDFNYKWIRKSTDTTGDTEWNLAHENVGNKVKVTDLDVNIRATFACEISKKG